MASLLTDDTTTTTTTTTTTMTRRRTTTTEASEGTHLKIYLVYYKYIGTATKPGLIAYFDDDIVAMINMFAKTCKKFLEYDPCVVIILELYYKKYGVNFDDSRVTLDGKNIRDEDLQI